MAKAIKLKLARLQEVLRRQDPPRWGCDYEPAMRASREEAPSRSRPAQVWSELLGRYCHVLSLVEQKVLLLALFQPMLFELQEQRMLATDPRPHPLAGHSLAVGLNLPGLRGTIDVCDRLDMIDRHLWISVDHPDGDGRIPVPAPFIGDLLLFLSDQQGPYCVNWTIKGSLEEFQRRPMGDRPARRAEAEAAAVRARHAIEDRYYLDAGIPTIRIVNHDIPEMFAQNLRSLILMQHRAANADVDIYSEVCDRLNACIQTGLPPIEALLSVVHRYDVALDFVKALFCRAIWRRDVRPELIEEPLLIDHPLKPERCDPLQVYAEWFQRRRS